MGPLIPLFWTSGDISSGFQSQSGFCLSRGICFTLHIPWDSPLVWHLPTSWQPAWQPSRLFRIPARHWWDLKLGAIMPPLTVWDQAGQTLYRLSYPGSAFYDNILSTQKKISTTLATMSDLSLKWKLRKTLLWYTSHVILIKNPSSTSRMSPKKEKPFHTSSLFDTMTDKVIGKALHCKSLNIGSLWYNMAITVSSIDRLPPFMDSVRGGWGVENSSYRSTLVTPNGLKDSFTLSVNSVFPKCFSLKSLNSVTKNICHYSKRVPTCHLLH